MNNWSEKVNFIWSIAELLRGPYRPNQYKDVILPMTVLRRLDCVLEGTKDSVLQAYQKMQSGKVKDFEKILNNKAGYDFHNISKFTFKRLKNEPDKIAANLTHYIKGFSGKAREIIEHFGFEEQIARLDKADRLFLLVARFCEIDLHPDAVDNLEMGYIFEELVRRFNEASNEEAGDHFTPREVIQLMVNLVFMPDSEVLKIEGIVKSLYDPAAGTGGMLSVSDNYVRNLNPEAQLVLFAQDYNPQSYAICGSDMMIKGEELDNIKFGDSFTNDQFAGKTFDYMLANPPFGVEWKPQEKFITREYEEQGLSGRFGAGLPRISDGSLLFLQHMISKMKPFAEGGTRLAIVFNGSPLFTGSAGSGESNIRQWIIENDWLDAVVALPDQLFYNTGIYTYLWIVSNRKEKRRQGKIQLIDATSFYKKMRKSLGNKRNEICEEQREQVTRLFMDFSANEYVRIFDNADFGYYRITVERPLRLNFEVNDDRLEKVKNTGKFQALAQSLKRKDARAAETEIAQGRRQQEAIINALKPLAKHGRIQSRDAFSERMSAALRQQGLKLPAPLFKDLLMALAERDESAEICRDARGNPEPDPDLRDFENVPLKQDINEYLQREVLPHVPDAWIDDSKTKIGYEINFNRYFYKYTPPRPLEEIESDLKQIEAEIADMLKGVIK